MSARPVCLLMEKELRDARRSRWFVLLSAVFAGLALALAVLGTSGLGSVGGAGFGRTAASLLNLVVLVVPLMGLLMGALSVAPEREQGTLTAILAQPVLLGEVFLGKFLGLAAALLGTVLAGFGLAALVIARREGLPQVGAYLALVGYTFLLGLGFLSVGFLISALARRSSTAVGAALFAWLTAEFLSDLGLIGTAVALRLSPRALLWLSLANPAQVFKLIVLQGIRRNLEALGPGGVYATEVLGGWLVPCLAAILVLWAALPLTASVLLLRNRGVS